MTKELIKKSFNDSIKAKQEFLTEANIELISDVAELIVEAFKSGNKLMIAGNGGSAADAQHLAAEFTNRFEIERPPLPALALTTDSSALTAIGNDYDFDLVFSKQVKALGKAGDILLLISTSGMSANLIKAALSARDIGIKTVALTGKDGGELTNSADITINVASVKTPRIQEVHITVCHILCQLVDDILF